MMDQPTAQGVNLSAARIRGAGLGDLWFSGRRCTRCLLSQIEDVQTTISSHSCNTRVGGRRAEQAQSARPRSTPSAFSQAVRSVKQF
jgi:hypothetical protein